MINQQRKTYLKKLKWIQYIKNTTTQISRKQSTLYDFSMHIKLPTTTFTYLQRCSSNT